ncbi:MAG: TIGR03905 family TSCPD domain-containing protein [Clostridia bacterium]|nr:TIGR03905 family TSCPD domain-containing protein [Clostridia bacterium]
MTKTIEYKTKGTCSRQINVQITDGIIDSVEFIGGCNGNTKGIAQLVKGMKATDIIERVKGTDCRGRGTSCPDQLALALEAALAE